MKRVKLSRSEIGKLSAKVRAFNRKLDELGLADIYGQSYQEVKSKIYTKKGYRSEIARMDRLLRKGATDTTVTDQGLVITKWERNEYRLAQKRTNTNLKNMPHNRRLQINTQQIRQQTRSYNEIEGYFDFRNTLKSYMQMGHKDYLKFRENVVRDNLVKSIEWAEYMPGYKKLKEAFQNAPYSRIMGAMNNDFTPTTINLNYAPHGASEDTALEYFEYISEAWLNELNKKVDPNAPTVKDIL